MAWWKPRRKQGLGDDALVGVLAHEIGHVVHRHTTRMLVEQAVLNVGLGLALGDVSSLVSIGGSLLTGLAYRRNHETEADCFAAALMRKAQLPTEPMADLLLGMEKRAQGGAGRMAACWAAFSAAIRLPRCARGSSSKAGSKAVEPAPLFGCHCGLDPQSMSGRGSRVEPGMTAPPIKSVKSADKPDSVALDLLSKARRDRHSSGPPVARQLGATYP